MFGSYIEKINSKDTSDKMIDYILNKVERRHNTILYLLNNRVLSLKSDKIELDNILKTIVDEYNNAVVNPKWLTRDWANIEFIRFTSELISYFKSVNQIFLYIKCECQPKFF